MANNELYHFGILGQKWGKRNGPPYPLSVSNHSSAEKKHLDKYALKTASSEISKATKAGVDTYAGIRKTISQKDNYEKAKSMSDEELAKEIKRLRMEQEFANLTSNDIARGQAYVRTIYETTMSAAALVTASAGAVYAIKKILR